ncbi:wall-associated receptor kinase 2 [Elysia marginata]|uniref:Wall-associated receptor kinase 2 n=1 Tax=Elysia marginata TaxID=1093978 RepID=A0AAV4IBD2_9GAST|nr:wall-associated receptor kinase 2 [Elysia marginata]
MNDFDPAIVVAIALAVENENDVSRRKRAKWPKQWFLKRSTFGHTKLLRELSHNKPVHEGFKIPQYINECDDPRAHSCPANSVCVNTRYSYSCNCKAGFEKDSDSGQCEGEKAITGWETKKRRKED